eukprot:933891-Rhodomonas_salina.1
MHEVRSGLEYAPASHGLQLVLSMLDENLPGGQAVQLIAPRSSVYVPASHAVQGPGGSPANPGLHLQSAILELRSSDSELSGQSMHTAALSSETHTFAWSAQSFTLAPKISS